MCPVFKNQASICKMKGLVHFDNGLCRPEGSRTPNQRVYPGAKVLCADLSCRNKYDDCIITEEKPKQKQRCVGQQLERNAEDCPSTITCQNENQVVCPDGTCADNEIYCNNLKECTEDLPYICQNNECAYDFDSCDKGIACGEAKYLGEDKSCHSY